MGYKDGKLPSTLLWSFPCNSAEDWKRITKCSGIRINQTLEPLPSEFWAFINAYINKDCFDGRSREEIDNELSKDLIFLEICKAAGINFDVYRKQQADWAKEAELMKETEPEVPTFGLQAMIRAGKDIPTIINHSTFTRRLTF